MNWLTRLEVDAEVVRAEKIFDNYAWHKRLWEDCFPDAPRDAPRDFLTRIDRLEGAFRAWVLAKRKPEKPRWCPSEGFAIKEIAPSFLTHQFYVFDLRANPIKTTWRGPNGEALSRGKRIPLVKPEELRAWLVRKGKVRCRDKKGEDVPGGFRIVEEKPLEISPMVENHFRKKGQTGYHGGVQFRGILKVTDREKFIETYQSGIGSAKSFGFGLLLLAPINL
ncbi:type I-E CRISPR-associated protein Cas6/Cse3/CasE [bacterium]|nr:type I-E CRISPR-associated protein Cas6/Cse3/CasE [bacterium]MBU1615960.1 type I-E CRISPR-associated protein Cas6/Cse3/CasE [bacterium]